jgi:hypothetical protein
MYEEMRRLRKKVEALEAQLHKGSDSDVGH